MAIFDNSQIRERESHIVDLARIVAVEQGANTGAAKVATIIHNQSKSSQVFGCDNCGRRTDEGDAQWYVKVDDEWGACRFCLVDEIVRGDVILDRSSAHEQLAFMLGGQQGLDGYRDYFVRIRERDREIEQRLYSSR